MTGLALTGTVNGFDGWMWLIALLAFLVAAVVAWAAPGHKVWAVLVAAGLCLAALTHIVH